MSSDFIRSAAGISVWAMDWCALTADHDPSGDGSTDYLAVGGFPDTAQNCEDRDLFCKIGVQDAHPNMIQIWSMNCGADMEKNSNEEPKAHLDLCIAHDYGTVMDLKWCPSGNFAVAGSHSGDIPRLGILAAAFSDGIRNHEPYVTIELGELCIMSLSWGTARRLAAGCSNGAIAVFDINAMLSQSKATLSQPDSEYLDPIFFSQVHQVSVRTVDWVRDCDASMVPWVILSSGYDGVIRYTDLRGFSRPVVVTVLIGMSMTVAWLPWANGCVYVDRDLAVKVEQLYQGGQAFRVLHTEGTIWDISYSDYHPYLAAGASNGMVLTVNPHVKLSKRDNMVQFPAYQLSTEVAEKRPRTLNSESRLQPDEEQTMTTTNVFRYNDKLEKHNVPGKTVAHYYNDDTQVAIQKVQWSRCFHSASWLASASGSGLLRVENMLHRQTENKPATKLQGKAKKVVSPVNVCNDIVLQDVGQQKQPKDILNSTATATSHNVKKRGRPKSRKEASPAQHCDVDHVIESLPAATGVDIQAKDQQPKQLQKSIEKKKRGRPRKLAE
ncbi:hypothetical protein BGZ51_002381 [Haplosporangium sp. Z 767]|nr:hypothetical protein BGZ51_002381 [Haplosporangium sp. Z 767]